MDSQKFCKDCQHFKDAAVSPKCFRPGIFDLINGLETNSFCVDERYTARLEKCGPAAQFFSPKPPTIEPA